jgi:hypothetical protein
MMNEKETFKDAMQVALDNAKKTGERYFILFPAIANPGLRDVCHLLVPVLHESAIEPNELEDIAFTVYPNGTVCWGNTARHPA